MTLQDKLNKQDEFLNRYDDWMMDLSRHLGSRAFYGKDSRQQIAEIRLRITELRREMFDAGRYDL